MKIGEVSGCLEIIGDCNDTINVSYELLRETAEKEWNRIVNHRDTPTYYKSYYKLNSSESQQFDNKLSMPESFIEKYKTNGYFFSDLYKNPKLLYHENKPKTWNDLKDAIQNNKLYEVKCNNCGRKFYIDEISFKCVKWRFCIGTACIKTNVKEEADYSKSEYEWEQLV